MHKPCVPPKEVICLDEPSVKSWVRKLHQALPSPTDTEHYSAPLCKQSAKDHTAIFKRGQNKETVKKQSKETEAIVTNWIMIVELDQSRFPNMIVNIDVLSMVLQVFFLFYAVDNTDCKWKDWKS